MSWCWKVLPRPKLTGEVYPIILVDGTLVGNLVCLIVRSVQQVVSWYWAGWESSNTWSELLEQLSPPIVVVCDGQKGILGAIGRCWPSARIQRCHFHIWQNIRIKLTLHPKTIAGQELLALTKVLLKGINTLEEAGVWEQQLNAWGKRYEALIRERTLADNPRPGQHKWWYTHGRLRSAYKQLEKLISDNQLFTYLYENLLKQTGQPIPRTTNYVVLVWDCRLEFAPVSELHNVYPKH